MELVGETIQHEQFGRGVVTALDHNIITIDFPTGTRRFLYPDAFKGFLVPRDTDTKEEINDLLVEQKLEEKRKELEALEHQKKLSHLQSLKISVNGQAVFDLGNQADNDPFATGCCSTGVYLSGISKGEFRVPQQMAFNTMCILTACPEGQPEKDRRILALAMASEDFEGAACRDGQVPFHPDYRLKLSSPVQVWPFLKKEPKKNWGHASFRYVSNQIGEEILYDLLQHSAGEEQKALQRFYNYYCECNRIPRR